MKRLHIILLFLALIVVGSCQRQGSMTVLFTSDVKGRLKPAG